MLEWSGMNKSHFKLLSQPAAAVRVGELKTRSGVVSTPFFMPVATRGSVKGLTVEEVFNTGARVILGNTYHLHLKPGEELIEKIGGLHEFMNWEGPILTDSGGFQVFSLSRIRKITEEGVKFKDPVNGDSIFITPEKSIQIQIALGSDIVMAFDDLTGLDEKSRYRTEEAVERTHRWLERCVAEFKKLTKGLPESKRPLFFGIAQGGLDKKLRKKSLEFVQSQEVDGVAIGGLSVGESRREMHEMLEYLAPLYDKTKVRYLMGVGDPVDVRFAIEHGIDMMDCVLPTRNARHGTVWGIGDEKLNLKNEIYSTDRGPINEECDCRACNSGYSRAFLRHQFKTGDPIAGSLASIHNLRYLARICEGYKKAAK